MRTRTRSTIETAVLALCLGLSASMACATVPAVDRLAAEQMSVRELMRMETDLALERARTALRKRDDRSQDTAGESRIAHSGSLKLVGIYGVGKKLLAEVEIGKHAHVYMRGQAFPVGTKGSPSAYRLREISGSCIQLERKEEAHTLCLSPSHSR